MLSKHYQIAIKSLVDACIMCALAFSQALFVFVHHAVPPYPAKQFCDVFHIVRHLLRSISNYIGIDNSVQSNK